MQVLWTDEDAYSGYLTPRLASITFSRHKLNPNASWIIKDVSDQILAEITFFSVQRLDVSYTPKQGIQSPDIGLYLPHFQTALQKMNQFSFQMVTVCYYGADIG